MSAADKGGNKLEEVNRLVLEYLEVNGMEKSSAAFVAECNTKAFPCPAYKPDSDSKIAFSRYDADKLLTCFDEGDLNGFLKLWNLFLSHVQLTSDDMCKLEVYLRVHFALWPKANGEPEEIQTQAMLALKIYFEGQSSATGLSNDASILPLFALPFVPEPMTHPVFRDLFDASWTQRLRAQLDATLAKYFDLIQENLESHSRLVSLVSNARQDLPEAVVPQSKNEANGLEAGCIDYHRDRFFQLVSTYRKVRKLLRGTRESYGKLLKVSNELIISLEYILSGNGSSMTMDTIMEKCCQIFPEMFKSDILSKAKPDKEYFKNLATGAVFDSILDSDVSLFFVGISNVSPECLDFGKIKGVLASSDESNTPHKLCLMQSLRWLLTKSTARCRQYAMDTFINFDLFGLEGSDPITLKYRDNLFSSLLSPVPTYVKECFARLLNGVASMKAGRGYLSKGDYCLEIFVNSLLTFRGHKESFICQMVVATLQKMSLRKHMRLKLIERKVMEWLVIYLKSELAKKETAAPVADPTSNSYLMEYGWALLMNLSLHEESKGPANSIAPDLLTLVVQMLMSKPGPDVAPYVVSTLYSLLRNPDIFAMCRRMNLASTFTVMIEEGESNINKHLTLVTGYLENPSCDRMHNTGEVDYDDDDGKDPDEFEPEIEIPETWINSLEDNVFVGDDLLVREYMLQTEDNAVVPPMLIKPRQNAQGTQDKGSSVYFRPTTPSKAGAVSTPPPTTIQSAKPASASEVKVPAVIPVIPAKPKQRPAAATATKRLPKPPSVTAVRLGSAKDMNPSGSGTKNSATIVNLNFPELKPKHTSSNPRGHTFTNLAKVPSLIAQKSGSSTLSFKTPKLRAAPLQRPRSPPPPSANSLSERERSIEAVPRPTAQRKRRTRSRQRQPPSAVGSANDELSKGTKERVEEGDETVAYYRDVFAAVGVGSGGGKTGGKKGRGRNKSKSLTKVLLEPSLNRSAGVGKEGNGNSAGMEGEKPEAQI